MQIGKIIKAVFEREIEENYSRIPPFPHYSHINLEKKTIIEDRYNHLIEIGLAACFIIVFGISVFFKDDVWRSPLANQGALIAQLFPESPKEAFYDFVSAIHSSF
jgi:hypothetical protein